MLSYKMCVLSAQQMAITPGTRLGPYEVIELLGAGGMGEVYLSRDTRLGRSVALKVLLSALDATPDVKARFEREARAISQLNHANICTLHDVGHHNGTDYLVMEYVEGETLAERLKKGALPLTQVLKVGAEIADALEKAHRAGIIHRDLKPGNIMLTKSGAKLMDFGLAKPASLAGVAAASAPMVSAAATMTSPSPAGSPLTGAGMIVGTIQYMSPEQIEGKEADKRSDIFAFGAVLYEMATGRRAFEGKSQLSVASAILEKDPEPITSVQPASPAALGRVVQHCLEKHPDDRLQSAGDLAWCLRDLASGEVAQRESGQGTRTTKLWTIAAAVCALVAALLGFMLWKQSAAPVRSMRFSVSLPVLAREMALSRDGEWMAVVAPDEVSGRSTIYLNRIGTTEVQKIASTAGASYPFWSPDAKQIGFFADDRLKKIAVAGGAPTELAMVDDARGGSWGADGAIIYAPSASSGIWKVAEAGGKPEQMTRLTGLDTSHRWPVFLPDGKHFIFLVPDFSQPNGGRGAEFAGSVGSPSTSKIADSDTNAEYVEPGYLIFVRNKTLMAQRFDASSLRTLAPPMPANAEAVLVLSVALAEFTTSENGTLLTGTSAIPRQTQLTWYDRSGKRLGTLGAPEVQNNLMLSPDGTKLALDVSDSITNNIDLFVQELKTDNRRRVTFAPQEDASPIWSPDATALYYRTFDSNGRLMRVDLRSDATREVVHLEDIVQDIMPTSVSPKGDFVFANINMADGKFKVAKVMISNGGIKDFLTSTNARDAVISPNGQWVAYTSQESGTTEMYVTSVNGEGKWQISHGGGSEARWRKDGKELFYLTPQNVLMAAPVQTGETFNVDTAVPLFVAPARERVSATDTFNYDVTADGQKFIVNKAVEASAAPPLRLILNWPAELKK